VVSATEENRAGGQMIVITADALERATRFLLARQGRDGLWRDFDTPAGEASHWPSGFIGTAMPLSADTTEALERAADTLVETQHPDGGWGYNENVPTDADSTAWVLRLLTRLGRDGACRRAARCLIHHQSSRNGGVATYSEADPIRRFTGVTRWVPFWGWCAPQTEVTAAVALALASAEHGASPAQVRDAWRFVQSRQRRDGSWSSYWWTSSHYATLQAVELASAVGDVSAVHRAALWTIVHQRDSGGWHLTGDADSAFASALAVSILLRADADAERVQRGLLRLLELQKADGSWATQPTLRIPLPPDRDPNGEGPWRPVRFGPGIDVPDQHRTFTTAACVAALALARSAGW
jgi:squalene-hopene/tetraprenyl-beta-curcumene cyclase